MTDVSKPIIGLTPSHNTGTDDLSLRPTYIRALLAAGALPVILPLFTSKEDLEQLTSLCSGFLFTGGPDPHPFLWGEEIHEKCGVISTPRDQMELALLSGAMKQKKPILGICRGAQIINIGLGGDIYQDIQSQYSSIAPFPIAHSQPAPYQMPVHHVAITPGTRLSCIASNASSISVNSCHHQAIRKVAPSLIAGGAAPDGIIEEIEMPGYPFLMGVQWHPEYLWETDKTSANLFHEFVNACQKYSSSQ